MNNKAKVYWLTKSVILEKTKIISYKDIKETQAKCTAKDLIKGKIKHSQKHKSTILEADKLELELEPELEVAQMIKAPKS